MGLALHGSVINQRDGFAAARETALFGSEGVSFFYEEHDDDDRGPSKKQTADRETLMTRECQAK
jgi:hypothetical protein